MIKTQTLVPENYYKESRDFQFFGRLYDVLYNYVKTNIDAIRSFPLNNTNDPKFLGLILRNLGFYSGRDYDVDQLLALAKSFSSIIKNKGSYVGIEKAIQTVLRSEGIKKEFSIDVEQDIYGYQTIVISIRDSIASEESALLEEVLDYIIPIGTNYYIRDISLAHAETPLALSYKQGITTAKSNRLDTSKLARNLTTTIEEIDPTNNVGTLSALEDHKWTRGSLLGGTLAKNKGS